VSNPIESIEYSREITFVYTQEYPIIVPMFRTGQMSMLSACCSTIDWITFITINTNWKSLVLCVVGET